MNWLPIGISFTMTSLILVAVIATCIYRRKIAGFDFVAKVFIFEAIILDFIIPFLSQRNHGASPYLSLEESTKICNFRK